MFQTGILWAGAALSFAAGIALWQMRRSAFPLLIARLSLGLIGFLLGRLYAPPSIHPGVTWAVYLISAAAFMIGVSIARYVRAVTSPLK